MKSLTKAALILGCASCAALPACNDNDQLPSNGDTQGPAEVRGADPSGTTTAVAKPVDLCADYGGFTALLAEETIRCTGTIGPRSFVIDDQGLLQNNFSSCIDGPNGDRAANLESVKNLIRLQNFRAALPRFQECLTDRYLRWSELFKRTELKSCPMWKQTAVFGEGNKASSKQHGKMQPKLPYVPASEEDSKPGVNVAPLTAPRLPPGLKAAPDERFVDIQVPSKSSILYEISYPQPEPNCDDPAVCAAQCAAFLPGFVVSAAGSQLVADPASWYRDESGFQPCTDPTTADPWCPPFVHAMSITRTSYSSQVPPGDLYGHPNRAAFGEHCFRWAPDNVGGPGFNYETDLVPECTGPGQTNCLARCGN